MTTALLGLILVSLVIREWLALRRTDSQLVRRGLARRLGYDLVTLAALAVLFIPPASTKPSSPQQDLDLAFVVDVSPSMAVADDGISRLDRARQDMAHILRQGKGLRFAMVAFGGQPVVLSPATRDREAIRLLIDGLEPGMVAAPGSAPEEAILLARKLLPQNGKKRILLYSDGERTWHEPPPPLPSDIPVDTLLPGADIPALVPGRQDDSALTRPDRERLEQIARHTGGRFQLLDGRTSAIEAILELAPANNRLSSHRDDLFIWLVFALLLARCLPRLPRSFSAALAGLALIALTGCNPTETNRDAETLFRQADKLPPSPQSIRLFERAAQKAARKLQAAALHNACSDALATDEPRRALDLCRRALLARPGQKETIRNLAIALRRIAALPAGAGPDGNAAEDHEGQEMTAAQAQALLNSLDIRPGGSLPPHGQPQPVKLEKDW